MNTTSLRIVKYLGILLFILSIIINVRSYFVIEKTVNNMYSVLEKTHSETIKVKKLLEDNEIKEAKALLDEQIIKRTLLLTIRENKNFFKD